MGQKVTDSSLPEVWVCEDTIFNICMDEIDEYPRYLTNLDDIGARFPKKHLSDAYKNLEVDFVRKRADGSLINIEHHVYITRTLLARDFGYLTLLHNASNRFVYPYIFNTGRIPNFTVEYANPTSFYNPIWINTQEIELSVKLNNIKYKILNQEELNVFDVCDLIWMPKFRSDESIEDIIMGLIEIYNNIIVDKRLLDIFRKCLVLWAGKFVKSEENIKKAIGGLNMSSMETDEMYRKVLKTIRIEGELFRSHENGLNEGLKTGKEIGLEEGKEIGFEEGKEKGFEEGHSNAEQKFILKLLEKYTPHEISREYDVPLERVIEIKNKNK